MLIGCFLPVARLAVPPSLYGTGAVGVLGFILDDISVHNRRVDKKIQNVLPPLFSDFEFMAVLRQMQ